VRVEVMEPGRAAEILRPAETSGTHKTRFVQNDNAGYFEGENLIDYFNSRPILKTKTL
jgi:hypothetical protein